MNTYRWTLFVMYFLITNISHNQAIRHRIFKENHRCRIEKTLLNTTEGCARLGPSVPDRPAKLDYTFYSIFSAYRRYRLHRLKIRHETLYVKNSTVNSSVLLPPHTLSSYFQSLGQHQPLEILFTIL